jgi:hypothetical protein
MMLAGALACALALTGAPPDPAPHTTRRPPRWPRLSLYVAGALATGSAGFSAERRFTEFAEEGRLDTDYERALGPGLDVGADFAFGRFFAVSAAYTLQRRSVSADYEGALPHPLYFARPRAVTGTVDGLEYAESALHLGLAVRREAGSLRYGAFAGPTWARVEPELLDRVQYRHAYPYDSVEVTGVSRGRTSGSGFGFHVGGALEYRLHPRLAAAAMVRYYAVSPALPDTLGAVELEGGSLLASAAVRFFLR